ncbi:MAG TPA: hypothetical protein VHG35_05865 [Gemmatimonadales bacterium]|nr:hypothetical protein [Gemmatimonadales bacterium]
MIPVIPWYIELIVLATNLTIAAAVWGILSSAAGRSGLPHGTVRRVRVGTAAFIGTWLGAALILAPAPETLLTQDPFALTPLVPIFVLSPVAIALVAILRSPVLRRVLAAASLPALIGVQLYRLIGIVFVALLALGQLPAHFAVPAGWGDIAVGLAAPLVALGLARGTRGDRALAVAWSVFGLVDLIIAIGMGTGLLAPFLVPGLGPRVPSAAAMGVFPMVLVPMFLVPMSVLLHAAALGKLRQGGALGLVLNPGRPSALP